LKQVVQPRILNAGAVAGRETGRRGLKLLQSRVATLRAQLSPAGKPVGVD